MYDLALQINLKNAYFYLKQVIITIAHTSNVHSMSKSAKSGNFYCYTLISKILTTNEGGGGEI